MAVQTTLLLKGRLHPDDAGAVRQCQDQMYALENSQLAIIRTPDLGSAHRARRPIAR